MTLYTCTLEDIKTESRRVEEEDEWTIGTMTTPLNLANIPTPSVWTSSPGRFCVLGPPDDPITRVFTFW